MRDNKKVFGVVQSILFGIYIKLKDIFDPKFPIREEEVYCTEICIKLINLEDSKLTLSPISNKRFILNDRKGISIIIHNRFVTLINHVYGYNMVIDDEDLYNSIIKRFDEVLEEKRRVLEEELRKNIQTSLKIILSKISDSPSEQNL